jgi:FtsZ-interacting cell division protein ZipA
MNKILIGIIVVVVIILVIVIWIAIRKKMKKNAEEKPQMRIKAPLDQKHRDLLNEIEDDCFQHLLGHGETPDRFRKVCELYGIKETNG